MHHWYAAGYRFTCARGEPKGERLQVLWGDKSDLDIMFSGNAEIDAAQSFPHISALSYMYAGVASMSLTLSPIVIGENVHELEVRARECARSRAEAPLPPLATPFSRNVYVRVCTCAPPLARLPPACRPCTRK